MKKLFEKLSQYLSENFIHFSIKEIDSDIYLIEIDNKVYELMQSNEEGKFFDSDFCWDCDRTVYDGYIYKFGGVWYVLNKGEETSVKLRRLKWMGKASFEDPSFQLDCFLGVHGPFEMLNGTGHYDDWVKKAKFLGIKKLGICEKGSLAGVFKFQNACKKGEIDPIIGMELPIRDGKKDLSYTIKAFVKNEKGWQSLLAINKKINIDNLGFISSDDLIERRNGLILVLDPKTVEFNDLPSAWRTMFQHQFYYQLDTVEYNKEERDESYLKNLKNFFNSKIEPIAMCDAWYVEKEYSILRTQLNKIAGVMNYESSNQHFKNGQEYFYELQKLFGSGDCGLEKFLNSYERALVNLTVVSEKCQYTFETDVRHLPRYIMTEEESKIYKDNVDMFETLIYEGLENHRELFQKNSDEVLVERIEREIEVIKYGEVVDYFLILRDIVNWCNTKGILLGAGRGSAAGSLVVYLLGITKVDPMKYELLFERFLNKGRIKVSLPDIDEDFPGTRRQEIKEYMERRFGETQVCSVGTYTTLQLKAAIADLGKVYGIPLPLVRKLNKILGKEGEKSIEDFLKTVCSNSELKNFVKTNPELLNVIFLILGQPKTSSIHACAMMIFPQEKTMYEWIPVREQKGTIVSEWEGGELDNAGFLKEDILGIEQLDKFLDILDLIEKNHGKRLDLYKDISKTDKKVFKYFEKGWLSDIFHFGAKGLSGYCVKMKPTSIEELSDCAALYRPGVIENNYHNEYLLRRSGEREIEYRVGTEDILSRTQGIFVYQEQVMSLMNKLGGMDLITCDTTRKAMGKKKIDVLKTLENQFVEGYCKNFSVSVEYASDFWKEIVKASSYLFNLSHSVSYSINGYNSLWFKVHYPIEFWSVAFSRAKKDEFPFYVNEIMKSGDIKISPVNINKSETNIVSEMESNSMYWALNSVNQCGEKAQEQLAIERSTNGEYFSFLEFVERHSFKGSSVNKSVVENLIYSGAFDKLEENRSREELLLSYRKGIKTKIDPEKDEYSIAKTKNKVKNDWWWNLQQKTKSGLAFFDYKDLIEKYLKDKVDKNCSFVEIEDLKDWDESNYQNAMMGGFVIEVKEMESKKGSFCKITLESNYNFIKILVFPDLYEEYQDFLKTCEGNLLLLNGKPVWNKRDEEYVLQTTYQSEFVKLSLV